MHVLTIKPNLR